MTCNMPPSETAAVFAGVGVAAVAGNTQWPGSKFPADGTASNAARTVGVRLAAVHSDAHTRTDSLNAYNQNI